MRLFTAFIYVVLFTLSPASGNTQAAIDRRALAADTRFLASDFLRGRDTGSFGHELAAEYVISRCVAMGLEPVGGSYSHPVPLTRAFLTGTSVRLNSPGTVTEYFDSAIPNFILANTPLSFSGTLVFVDLATGRSTAAAPFDGAVAVVGSGVRSSGVVDSLAALGFAGIVQLTPDRAVYDLYRESRGPSRVYLADHTTPSAFAGQIPIVIVTPELSETILLGLRNGAGIEVDIAVRTEDFASPNVVCFLPGTDATEAATTIALSAHLDHLGAGEPDDSGDSIYNGFSDNAAGVAMLLEIAGVLSSGPLTAHGVLFLFFTGEERGLLGSEYLASHPVWPTSRLAGLINLDAGAPPAPPARWEIVGGDASALGRVALDVAAAHGWGAHSSAVRPNSDFFPFHRSGIPAIFIIPGRRPYEGLTDEESEILFQRWDAYHRPGDEWSVEFPFSGLVRYAEYALAVLREFAAMASSLNQGEGTGPGSN